MGTDTEAAGHSAAPVRDGAVALTPGRSLLHSPAESLQDLRCLLRTYAAQQEPDLSKHIARVISPTDRRALCERTNVATTR